MFQRHLMFGALTCALFVNVGCSGNSRGEGSNPPATPRPADAPPAGQSGSLQRACTAQRTPVISIPKDGGTVALADIVSGTTPCPGKPHYILVTTPQAANFVQNAPPKPAPDGSFTGTAQFGEGEQGVGQKFLIRILVTDSSVSRGSLSQFPTDAVLSPAVSVTRTR